MTRSRRVTAHTEPLGADEFEQVVAAGRVAGLDEVGACAVQRWDATRAILEQRRAEGLAADMEFTYRNPARSTDPSRILRRAASIVVGARSYAQRVPEAPAGQVSARVARYATADHYARLEHGLDAVARELRALGWRAVVVSDDNALVDREAAWRAGIGWYGRNSNMLMPGRGSWFVLGSVVTDALIGSSAPQADGCGSCTRCLTSCPTDAIVAPGVIDARRCLAWLLQAPGTFPLEFREALGDRLYGCDDCQEVCPPNRSHEQRLDRAGELPIEDDPGTWLDALELLSLDDEALLERCARWYVPDRDASTIRRNLLLVVGNSGNVDDKAVRAALQSHVGHADPVIAEHARWAADHLGLSMV